MRMRAARMHRYGGNEVVVIDELDCPLVGPGEVLVRVEAAGVNPVDWKIREGYMSKFLPIQLPYTLGCDLSGTVEAIGEGVQRFRVGDAVYGYPQLIRSGAFAEAVVMLESELALAPTSMPLFEAAALPVAVNTAYDGLFLHGSLEAGMRVLILGGSGGVGSAAVQLAKWAGAEVFATASARNQDWLRSMGAIAIDYGLQSTPDVVQDVDLIFDTVSVESSEAALPSLKRGGLLVSSTYALPAKAVLEQYGVRAVMYGIQPSGERLSHIASIVDQGAVRMTIDRVYPLEETAQALAASQAGRTRGKLLIKPFSN